MKSFYTQLVVVMITSLTTTVNAQTIVAGKVSGFGVDADIYSGIDQSGTFSATATHDWFYKKNGTGMGIIDTAGAAGIKAALMSGDNGTISRGMAFPRYTVKDGFLLVDGRYLRDNKGLGGQLSDSTMFTIGSKNGMNPTSWGTNPAGGTVNDKTDIIDAYAHMRRSGTVYLGQNPNHMYLFMGAATVGTTGTHFVDLEIFRERIDYNKTTGVFTNSGPAATGGHSAWSFNADGSISQVGDMDYTFDYSSAAISEIAVYIWVAKTDVVNLSPSGFDFYGVSEFYGDGNGAAYGYAKIKPKNGATLPVWGTVNTVNTDGPVWGTNSKDLGASGNNYYSTQYAPGQLAEVGVDLTALGIDATFSSNNDACNPPFTRVMVKSRMSNSFTAALSDFTAPAEFMDAPQVPATIIDPAKMGCSVRSVQLNPQILVVGANYVWSTAGGNIVGPSTGYSITVDKPGKYYLTTFVAAGCATLLDSTYVSEDLYKPVASASRTGTLTATTPATILGGDSTASNYVTPFGQSAGLQWDWSGPGGYTSSIQNNDVNVDGTYRLILTEIRNGCQDTAYVYVPAAAALPVTLVDFTGSANNGNNLLKWNTSSEVITDRFEVERSIDGRFFTKVGQVKAAGTSDVVRDYSYTDMKAGGINFYRLKIINTNGTFSYSKVININSDIKSVEMYLVYPNPFGSKLQARITSANAEQAMVRIINSNGSTVKAQTISLQAGVTDMMIEASTLSPGAYYFEIITSAQTTRTKIIKQ